MLNNYLLAVVCPQIKKNNIIKTNFQ